MRARAWCFTLNASDVKQEEIDPLEHDQTQYICWGVERGENGRLHHQGYVEFGEGVSLRTAKRRLGNQRVHLERRRGTQEQAIAYCKKDLGKPDYAFVEHGERRQQGRRSDLDGVRELLGDGCGMRDVIDSGVNYQGLRYAEKVLCYTERGRDPASPYGPVVRWYWGETGTGKSRAAAEESARDYGSDVWWAADGLRWFDGYDAHPAAVLDDFRPDWAGVSLPKMLRLFDRFKLRVECKGGSRQWKPEVIWVTCPRPPAECFLDAGEDIAQLLRRVTVIKQFL